MKLNIARGVVMSCAVLTAVQSNAQAAVDVYVDFSPTWKSELDFATTYAGMSAFTENQKSYIREVTLSELRRIYSGYQINFHESASTATHHVITFADPHPGSGIGVYGSTNVNAVGGYSTSAVAKVFPKNFGGLLQQLPSGNVPQILAVELAGVAAHELGHIFGLGHQHIYANPGITPANYLDTGGLHRQHVMAVPHAPYGMQKNFNPFERAILDITGGTVLGGPSLVSAPVIEVVESGDAGNTPGSATALIFSTGESSGQQLSLQRGDLDGAADDVDLYTFTTTSTGALTVNLFSGRSYYGDNGSGFNSRIRLLGADGITVLADFDDLYYEDTVYNQATYIDQGGFEITVRKMMDDPFMVNIPLTELGTYYLEVSAVSDAQIGDVYQMLSAFSGTVVFVPEPAGAAVLAVAGSALLAMRRRAVRSARS